MKPFFLSLALLLSFHTGWSQFYVDLDFVRGSRMHNSRETIRANKITREEVYGFKYEKTELKDSFLFYVYEYDTSGCLVSVKDMTTKLPRNFRLAYNELGQLTEIDQGIYGTEEFEYDSAGNRIMDYWFALDTSSLLIKKREFNTQGRPVLLYIKSDAGDFYLVEKCTYDFEGYLLKKEVFDRRGEMLETHTYEIDRERRTTKATFINNRGYFPAAVFYYDTTGKCVKIINEFAKRYSNVNVYYGNHYVRDIRYNADGTFNEVVTTYKGREYVIEKHYYHYN